MISPDHITRHRLLKNAIFTICGSREPSASCLADVGRRAAQLAGRPKPWGDRHLYALLHVDRYDANKYRITDELLNALLALAGREATNGKHVVKVYAHHVRAWSIVLGHSRRCARRRCGVWFVSDTNRLYCSDECHHRARLARRKRQAMERRQVKLLRRRKGQRARGKQTRR